MKKNAMLKIAAILMVAVLLTTCAISSTFAKYVTTGSGSATARVAKFGLNVAVTVDGFDDVYATDDTNVKATIANSVDAEDDKDVLAPGTTKSIVVDNTVTGKAEVAVKLETTFVFSQEGFSESYFPVYFTIGENTYKHKSIDAENGYETISELFTAVQNAAKISENYAANATIDAKDTSAVTWTWDYEKANDVDTDKDGMNDVDELDNSLSAGTATIKVDVTTKLTQIN
jgi:hypothetical protein